MKRITIITDSLGLPRTCTDISLTWSDRFMQFVADSTNANTIGKQTIGGGGKYNIFLSYAMEAHGRCAGAKGGFTSI